ncbi:MAG TPA: carbohydrate ABC transporter substrate-binding protein, partial [Pararhizobium sp.]|nr:carbohydrate ABC transporter substrate-binding protein [Pararhizobium sp.]
MTNGRFSGLTWDHPRGYRALEAASESGPVAWVRQPLEGFESHPIADLAARHDLLVLDHPHIGEAIAEACLQPIEDWFTPADIAGWASGTIGRTLESYRWDRRHYALPLDVAMQVAARDPDRMPEAPDSWDDVMRLSETCPVALSLAGPHALLTFFSLCLSLGEEPGGEDLISDAAGLEALRRIMRLAERAPKGTEGLNPIALLEAIAARVGIALVPLVFGYVNYAVPARSRAAVAFSDAPRETPSGRRGSVLGGTGIGITRRAKPDGDLLAHLRWLMSDEAQLRFIPDHDGQPSARSAWLSPEVNAAWGGFYAATAETAEQAWVRPRFDGYIAFQTAASDVLRVALEAKAPAGDTLSRLRTLWRAGLARA